MIHTLEGHTTGLPGTRNPADVALGGAVGCASRNDTLASDLTALRRTPQNHHVTLNRTRRRATGHGPGASPRTSAGVEVARCASAAGGARTTHATTRADGRKRSDTHPLLSAGGRR
jgi:hypothetical protein